MTAPTALPPLLPDDPATAAQPATSPRIGLVLGAGGARGLAHVHALEALDELGLRPAAIVGTSMGAIIGAGAAAGLDGRQVREVIVAAFRNQGEVWARLWQLRPKSFGALFGGGLVQFDAERTLEVFLPPAIPADFGHLAMPFAVISADFYGCSEVVIADGPLRRAIAASIAIPLVFRPVEVDGVCLVDGGIVNPLPYDRVPAPVDLTVAVDVIGGPTRQPGRTTPSAMESVFGASQIMMQSVLAERLKTHRPDVLLRPNVDMFRVLDFLKANAILRATQGLKDDVKRAVEAALEERSRSAARGEEAAQ